MAVPRMRGSIQKGGSRIVVVYTYLLTFICAYVYLCMSMHLKANALMFRFFISFSPSLMRMNCRGAIFENDCTRPVAGQVISSLSIFCAWPMPICCLSGEA